MACVPAPGYQSAYNPPIPYTTIIAGGLRQAMAVFIQATLPSDHKRFTVNFSTAEGEDSDIALHMNARYDNRDRVVFNSRQSGQWKEEEMKKDMPFKAGKVFSMLFEITRNNYLVAANGNRFFEFAHRFPLDQVRWVSVSGDIIVQHLAILGCGPGVKGGLVLSALQTELIPVMGPPAVLPTVPFRANINGGMVPHRSVIVKGIPNGKSFVVNLKSGMTNDIAFHFNPRLNKGTLVRNSFVNGSWGQEETKVAKNPIKEGDYFELSIRAGQKAFKIFLNGSHQFDFEYRMFNLAQVDTLEAEGNVQLFYALI
ncbi:galectin-4-like [Aquarana catesbeiana]|uniref:galectin-4-like n=1 Tax=Aquarana catesbeiana TaxID=8400 RepID=UPI003CC93413